MPDSNSPRLIKDGRGLLTDALRDSSAAVRVRAVRIILDAAVRTDVDELSARVDALERFCATSDFGRSVGQRAGD